MNPRRHRNKAPEYFPSLDEVKQHDKWSVFEEILRKYDEGRDIDKARADIAGRWSQMLGVTQKEVFGSAREFVTYFYGYFCLLYGDISSPHLDEFREIERIREFLDDIEIDLLSEAEKRHAMWDELIAAGATWTQITAMITGNWETLEQGEREEKVAWLTENHKNYKKKYPSENPPKKRRGTN
jgi:hypothetical protein